MTVRTQVRARAAARSVGSLLRRKRNYRSMVSSERRTGISLMGAAAVIVALTMPTGGAAQSSLPDPLGASAGSESRAAERALPWELEEVWRLDGHGEGPYSFAWLRPEGLAADTSGHVYALDGTEVRVFDAEGLHLRTLGRTGSGPGEIMRARHVSAVPGGGVTIVDEGRGRLIRFGTDGELQWDRQLPARRAVRLKAGATSTAFWSLELEAGDGAGDRAAGNLFALLRYALGPEGSLADPQRVLSRTTGSKILDGDCPGPGVSDFPRIFAQEPAWHAWETHLVIGDPARYQVEVRRLDGIRLILSRDVPPIAATREMALAEVHEHAPCGLSPAELVAQVGFEPFVPIVTGVRILPDGLVAVRRRVEATEGPSREWPMRVDVFSAEGRYLGTLPEDFPWEVEWSRRDHIVAVEEDSLGIPQIALYRIRR